jgi:tetratricopeptide (TPR) repeat protein
MRRGPVGKKAPKIHVRKAKAVHTKRHWKGVDNTKDIDIILAKSKLNQDLLGFTGDYLSKLFEQAVMLLQQHRFDEAVQGFEFLTKLNPYVPDFWIGLGLAHSATEAFGTALSAFLTAQTMDPSRIDAYSYAIDCSIEMKDLQQAEAILLQALDFAKKHPHLEDVQGFIKELQLLQDRIEGEAEEE